MAKFLRDIRHRAIIGKIIIEDNLSLLDTSCGDGSFVKALVAYNATKNITVSGVDMNETHIRTAKENLPLGNFTFADNASLPYEDASFDILINALTFHHMSDPISSLREMKRVLKSDGCIYLIDVIPKSLLMYRLLNIIGCKTSYHFEKFYSMSEIAAMFTESGLEIRIFERLFVWPLLKRGGMLSILTLQHSK